MTQHEEDILRLKLADFDGWCNIRPTQEARTDGTGNWIDDFVGTKNGLRCSIPDYLYDLDAIHLLETKLTGEQNSAYFVELSGVCGLFVHKASAIERAKALVKII